MGELNDEVQRYISENDRFGKLAGVNLLEVKPGFARGEMAVRDAIRNSVGTVHGGAIFTLADIVFAAASNACGKVAVAANVSISYLKAAREGKLLAEAVENSRGKNLAHYTVTVSNTDGKKIAVFQGTAYILNDFEMPPDNP